MILSFAQMRNIKAIENQVKNSAGLVDPKLADEIIGLFDQYLSEEKFINEIRQDFNRFASKWMQIKLLSLT